MTAKELKNYPYIIEAIKRYERELAELWDNSVGSLTPDMSGMPHSPSFSVSKVESGYENNEKYITEITKRLNTYRSRKARIDQFFENITNERTYQIFELRFKKQLTWEQVAAKCGGETSSESVRKVCDRYLKKSKYF